MKNKDNFKKLQGDFDQIKSFVSTWFHLSEVHKNECIDALQIKDNQAKFNEQWDQTKDK